LKTGLADVDITLDVGGTAVASDAAGAGAIVVLAAIVIEEINVCRRILQKRKSGFVSRYKMKSEEEKWENSQGVNSNLEAGSMYSVTPSFRRVKERVIKREQEHSAGHCLQ